MYRICSLSKDPGKDRPMLGKSVRCGALEGSLLTVCTEGDAIRFL